MPPKKVEEVDGRRKLLFLCQTLPYPPHGGVEARTYNVLRLLASEFDVTALCFYRRGGAVQGRINESVEALGRYARVQAFPIPQERSRLRFAIDHLLSLAQRRVYTVRTYESVEFREALRDLLRKETFDVVHMDSMDLSGYLPLLDGLPVICVHHNVESQLLARRATVISNPLVGWYLRHQAALMAKEELRQLANVALNVTVSRPDAELLKRRVPDANFHVVPNGVDIAQFVPSDSVQENELVFLGGTAWFPNLDGMSWFCESVLPLLHRAGSHPRVVWVGKATDAQKRHFSQTYGVEMTGYVPDVRPYVGAGSVFIVPLRFGGGTRLKILDAWAMGKAVVSTSVGCEGLDARDGVNIVVRDEPEQFALTLTELLRDPGHAAELGRAARATAEQLYDWNVIGRDMIATYIRTLERPSSVG